MVTQDPARREAALGLVRWLVSAQHMADRRVAYLVPTRRAAVDAWPLDFQGTVAFADLLSNSVAPSCRRWTARRAAGGLTTLLQRKPIPQAAAAWPYHAQALI